MAVFVIAVSSVTFVCILFYARKFFFYEVQFLTNEGLKVGEFFVALRATLETFHFPKTASVLKSHTHHPKQNQPPV